MTTILTCHPCKAHFWQDATHGAGRRVHNRTRDGARDGRYGWRCTVCGNEKAESGEEAKR